MAVLLPRYQILTPGRNDGSGAATTAAHVAGVVVGVEDRAVHRVNAGATIGKLMHPRLAQDNAIGIQQAVHYG